MKIQIMAVCKFVALNRAVWGKFKCVVVSLLSSETVEGPSLTFQCINDVLCSDCPSFGVLSVGDSVLGHIIQEDFQNTLGLFVDESLKS